MGKKIDYYEENQIRNRQYADTAIAQLPYFCKSFFQNMRADEYSERTICYYAYDLIHFFNFLMENNPTLSKMDDITTEILDILTIDDFTEYKNAKCENGQKASARTVRRRIVTLKAFYKYLSTRGDIHNTSIFCVTLPKMPDKPIVSLEVDEITSLIQVTQSGETLSPRAQKYQEKTKYRDYAIVLTLVSTGMRLAELVGMDVEKLDFRNNAVMIHRKGNEEQYVYYSDEVKEAIRDYITFERKPKYDDEEALFLSTRGTRINPKSVERIVEKYANHPAVTLKHITPHKLRSTFGTNLYRETGDAFLVADALNHKSVDTAAKHYIAKAEESRKRVKDIKFVSGEHAPKSIIV